MKKKTSIKDIAAHVGVSTALVSYVLNGKKVGRISKEVTEKIKQAALELNYQPSHIARSLQAQKTFTIGLIVADISNPFSAQISRIIEDEAYKNGYSVIFGSNDENSAKTEKLIQLFINRQVDGLIVALPENSENQVMLLQNSEIPFVLFDRYFPEFEVNSVIIDNYSASVKAIHHLQKNGHKRIGIITYITSLQHLNDRRSAAMQTAGNNCMVGEVRINHVQEDVSNAIDNFLNNDNPVDSIYFTSNLLTIAGLKRIKELQIKVPQQVAIVGFDGTDAFELFYSSVSYVKQPLQDIGKEAVDLLVEAIKNPKTCKTVRLNTELILRQSS